MSDTNRFNRDAGVPAVDALGVGENARHRLRLTRLGMPVEWEEEPFEWVRPHRFSVSRRYLRGPVASMRTDARLEPRAGGGTRLIYEVRARPRNMLGLVAIPLQIGLISRRRFAEVFRRYDAEGSAVPPKPARLVPGGRRRLDAARDALLAIGLDTDLVERLHALVGGQDDVAAARIRPYALADLWGVGRRETLALCLHATRAGMLELRWDVLCPSCRGPVTSETLLDSASRTVHCDTCRIDFAGELDRSVEVVFTAAPAIRTVVRADYCVAGPQVTPHVVAQQLVPPEGGRSLETTLERGRYRLRALALAGMTSVTVEEDGAADARARVDASGWTPRELRLAGATTLTLENSTTAEQLFLLERTVWSDQAATAAEVTALQVFRDLFATEVIRPAEPVSIGTLTVAFTDLRGSTRFYREVGDARAFGSVLEHLDLLRDAVGAEEGAVVKTMGDAIMAVFVRPIGAVRAMLAAQSAVAGRPLELKVGIHTGPCIAVNQNGVLDYFGSTVNLAARLVSLSSGDDLVVSETVLADPEVADVELRTEPLDAELKGFEGERVMLFRVKG